MLMLLETFKRHLPATAWFYISHCPGVIRTCRIFRLSCDSLADLKLLVVLAELETVSHLRLHKSHINLQANSSQERKIVNSVFKPQLTNSTLATTSESPELESFSFTILISIISCFINKVVLYLHHNVPHSLGKHQPGACK